jgi:hypothetical protein
MAKILSFEDFKRKKLNSKEFKVELSKESARKIQESLKKINELMKETKELASKNYKLLEEDANKNER